MHAATAITWFEIPAQDLERAVWFYESVLQQELRRETMRPLLERIARGEFDPSFIVSHRLSLNDAPQGYEMFKHKEEECVKVVLKP